MGQSCDQEQKSDSTSLNSSPDEQPSVCVLTMFDALKGNSIGERQKGRSWQSHNCCPCSMLCGAVNIRVITGMALITDMHCATTHVTRCCLIPFGRWWDNLVIMRRNMTAHPSTSSQINNLLFVAKPCLTALKGNSTGERQTGQS